jgi:hypothetical protein
VHLHFGEPHEVEAALGAAGFDQIEVRAAASVASANGGAGSRLAHVLEAAVA